MTCNCGRQTNDPSGICAICKLQANDPDTIIQGTGNRGQGTAGTKAQKHKGQKKNNVPRETYICIQCQKPYKPTSSAQKRCPACKKIHIAEYQKKYKSKILVLQPHVAHKKTHQPSTVNCEVTGCKNPIKSSGMCNKHYLQKLKNEGRIGIRKTHNPSQVSRKNLSAQTRGQDAEPESHVSRPLTPNPRPEAIIPVPASVIPAKAGIQSDSNGFLAQMLYASSLLDQLINSALKNGSIDTTIILDIRFRLGEVVRENIP